MENRYENAKIYAIKSKHTKQVYIGSTILSIDERRKCHLKDLRRHKYCSAQDIINLGDYEFVLIENYPCKNVYELRKRERFYIELFDTVNKIIPTQTWSEWNQKRKEKRKLQKQKELEEKALLQNN